MSLEELRRRALAAPTLDNLRALSEALATELRAINTDAGDAELTEAQTARWTELEAEHTATAERITNEERAQRVRDSRARWGATQAVTGTPGDDGRDVRSLNRQELRSRGLALLDNPEVTSHFNDNNERTRAQEVIAKMLRTQTRNFNGEQFARYMLATETDEYRSAFMKLMAGGTPILTAEEGRSVQLVNELRAAMNITTDSAGGYGVPVLIDPTIILTAQGHPNDFFDIARVENITTDEWRGVSSAGATSYWTTEGTTVTGGEPTLAGPNVVTKKLTTFIKYSFEIGGDYPGFANEMAMVMGESHSETLVSAFTNGLGTTAQPYGVITAIEATAASQVLVTTDGSFGATDLYKLWDALPIRYRNNARWMASTSVANAVRQFATGSSNSDANFTLNITQMSLNELFGRPFHYNDYMDDVVGTGGVTSASSVSLVIVGDFRNFLIANRVGATVETVQHIVDTTTGLPTGQRGTLMWARIGSDSINDNGFRLLTQA